MNASTNAVTHAAAVVAGVGPGLGSALVETFADAGYTVFAAARNASNLGGLQRADGRAVPVDCDAADPAQVESLFGQVRARGLPLAVAVYNAGVFEPGGVAEIEPADFERCWRVGCFGGFLVGRAAAQWMLERGEGTILFTGATASLRGAAGFANLAAPKFALRALAQSMARELGPKGIHVAHVVIDGQIRAERFEHLLEQRGPDSLLEPAAIAETYLALHRQHRSAWTDEVALRPWVEKF